MGKAVGPAVISLELTDTIGDADTGKLWELSTVLRDALVLLVELCDSASLQ